MSVTVGGDDFEDAIVQLENGDVERPAAEVVHGNRFPVFLVETVGQRCCRGLVHQPQHFQSGDAARVLGGLPLRVIEVRRNGDDRLGDRRGEIALRIALQLAQDERGNFRRCECLVAQLDAQHFARREVLGQTKWKKLQLVLDVLDAAAHQALHAVDSAFRRFDQVFARRIANDDLAVLVERHHRRHQVQSVLAGNDDRTVALHEGHQRVGGAQIDADDAFVCHCSLFAARSSPFALRPSLCAPPSSGLPLLAKSESAKSVFTLPTPHQYRAANCAGNCGGSARPTSCCEPPGDRLPTPFRPALRGPPARPTRSTRR